MNRLHRLEAIWIVPALVLTITNGLIAWFVLPSHEHFLAGLKILPFWLMATACLLVARFVWKVFQMMFAGVEQPTRELSRWSVANARLAVSIVAFMLVAWANMIAFLYIKPVLNIVLPFSADPLLARIDHALFLGNDPWIFLTWLNADFANKVYHPVWFAMMIVALMILFAARTSPKKTAMALSYFLLWSVIGPLVHLLLPAGGPIFYERLGYGDRFAGLDPGQGTLRAVDFLWRMYTTGEFQPAAGISAMPSMHVTIAAWTVLCFACFKPLWAIPVALVCGYITLLSVSLGWHYAVDGLVGALLAVATFLFLRSWLERTCPAEEKISPRAPATTPRAI